MPLAELAKDCNVSIITGIEKVPAVQHTFNADAEYCTNLHWQGY